MKSKSIVLGAVALSLVCAGCSVMGAGVGALAGAAIGGKPGALVGGITGLCIGAAADAALLNAKEKNINDQTLARMRQREPLTIDDIIKLSQGGLKEDLIIGYIEESGSSYSLSQAQIKRLQDENVSQRIINYMIG